MQAASWFTTFVIVSLLTDSQCSSQWGRLLPGSLPCLPSLPSLQWAVPRPHGSFAEAARGQDTPLPSPFMYTLKENAIPKSCWISVTHTFFCSVCRSTEMSGLLSTVHTHGQCGWSSEVRDIPHLYVWILLCMLSAAMREFKTRGVYIHLNTQNCFFVIFFFVLIIKTSLWNQLIDT